MHRVVLDTNVLVSSLLSPTGPPARIREAAVRREIIWCLSRKLLEEYADVLARPRFQKSLWKGRQALLTSLVADIAEVAEFPSSELHVERVVEADPDDDIVLATAVACRASLIVTGDDHLLPLRQHRSIRIVRPRAALEVLGLTGPSNSG